MCQPHWEQLKQAIKDRGLYDLVPKGGQAAAEMMARQMASGNSLAAFDPLMTANNMIWGNALQLGGLAMMQDNTDGSEPCPYCYVLHEGPKHGILNGEYDDWIDKAADGVKAEYERLQAEAKN